MEEEQSAAAFMAAVAQLQESSAQALREITALSPRFVRVTKRDSRTQRSFLEATEEGQALAVASLRI